MEYILHYATVILLHYANVDSM